MSKKRDLDDYTEEELNKKCHVFSHLARYKMETEDDSGIIKVSYFYSIGSMGTYALSAPVPVLGPLAVAGTELLTRHIGKDTILYFDSQGKLCSSREAAIESSLKGRTDTDDKDRGILTVQDNHVIDTFTSTSSTSSTSTTASTDLIGSTSENTDSPL